MSAPDDLRFGGGRTLDLHVGLPSVAEATRRTERFLRDHQLHATGEVLVITGRGKHSEGGAPAIRPAVDALLFRMKRRGVVSSHHEHNAGAFVVRLAPIRTLSDVIPRLRDRRARQPAPRPIAGLSAESSALLRSLAERSLDELGVEHSAARIEDEMRRHLRALAPSLPADSAMDAALQRAVRAALADYE